MSVHSSTATENDDSIVDIEELPPCAPASLYAITHLQGMNGISWQEVEQILGPGQNGVHSFAEIEQAATDIGLHPIGVKVDSTRLIRLPAPAILHFELNRGATVGPEFSTRPHFAAAADWDSEGIVIIDAPRQPRKIPWNRIERIWTGNALLFPKTTQDRESIIAAMSLGLNDKIVRYASLTTSALVIVCFVTYFRRRMAGIWRKISDVVHRMPLAIQSARASVTHASRSLARHLGILCAIGALLLLVGTTAFAWSWISWANEARLQVPMEVLDQGILPPGIHRVSIPLRNTGGAPLCVTNVITTCSCSVAEKPGELGPGQSKEMSATINVAPGPGFTDVVIESNAPNSPHRVTLHWNGTDVPVLVPPRIVGMIPADEAYQRRIRVAYAGGYSAVSPEFVRFDCEYLGTTIKPLDSNPVAVRTDESWVPSKTVGYLDLALTVPPSQFADDQKVNTTANIYVKYGNEIQKLPLRLQLTRVSKFRSQPERVVFSGLSPVEIVGQERIVTLIGCKPKSAVKISDCPDWLDCNIVQSDSEDCMLKLTVTKPPITSFQTAVVELFDEGNSHESSLTVSTITP